MSHDHHTELPLQVFYQILDLGGCNRVESTTWFVHQDNIRVDCEGSCNTEPLLLSS